MRDYIIIGGGIIGLSTAYHLCQKRPQKKILLLEKEAQIAQHQTSHNSGVIHSGLYYEPNSLKAKFCTAGCSNIVHFCQAHGIKYEVCGKVIVAVTTDEVFAMRKMLTRGLENRVPIREISIAELKEIEPYVQAKGALHVPSTGVVNYGEIAKKLAELFIKAGGEIRLNTTALNIHSNKNEMNIETNQGVFKSKYLIACAGLQSDRIAKKENPNVNVKIVPFRGEYYDIVPEKKHLVSHLIYPVSNPNYPFLGTHFTRHIDGRVSVGPNAVLNLGRENYKKWQINKTDLWDVVSYPGFWRLLKYYSRAGAGEIIRSLVKSAFVKKVQCYFPELTSRDLIPSSCGIRAQALNRNGRLLSDFHIINGQGGRSIHICNAPSPAATSSLQIGQEVARRLETLVCLKKGVSL